MMTPPPDCRRNSRRVTSRPLRQQVDVEQNHRDVLRRRPAASPPRSPPRKRDGCPCTDADGERLARPGSSSTRRGRGGFLFMGSQEQRRARSNQQRRRRFIRLQFSTPFTIARKPFTAPAHRHPDAKSVEQTVWKKALDLLKRRPRWDWPERWASPSAASASAGEASTTMGDQQPRILHLLPWGCGTRSSKRYRRPSLFEPGRRAGDLLRLPRSGRTGRTRSSGSGLSKEVWARSPATSPRARFEEHLGLAKRSGRGCFRPPTVAIPQLPLLRGDGLRPSKKEALRPDAKAWKEGAHLHRHCHKGYRPQAAGRRPATKSIFSRWSNASKRATPCHHNEQADIARHQGFWLEAVLQPPPSTDACSRRPRRGLSPVTAS